MKFSEVELPSNKKFGFFFSLVFLLLGAYFLYKENVTVSYSSFIVGSLFFVITLVKASLLLPLNKLWMQLGLLMGMIVSPIVLGIIFFGLFTPISIFMRLFRRDELRLKVSKKSSHWIIRSSEIEQTENFKHQF